MLAEERPPRQPLQYGALQPLCGHYPSELRDQAFRLNHLFHLPVKLSPICLLLQCSEFTFNRRQSVQRHCINRFHLELLRGSEILGLGWPVLPADSSYTGSCQAHRDLNITISILSQRVQGRASSDSSADCESSSIGATGCL